MRHADAGNTEDTCARSVLGVDRVRMPQMQASPCCVLQTNWITTLRKRSDKSISREHHGLRLPGASASLQQKQLSGNASRVKRPGGLSSNLLGWSSLSTSRLQRRSVFGYRQERVSGPRH